MWNEDSGDEKEHVSSNTNVKQVKTDKKPSGLSEMFDKKQTTQTKTKPNTTKNYNQGEKKNYYQNNSNNNKGGPQKFYNNSKKENDFKNPNPNLNKVVEKTKTEEKMPEFKGAIKTSNYQPTTTLDKMKPEENEIEKPSFNVKKEGHMIDLNEREDVSLLVV